MFSHIKNRWREARAVVLQNEVIERSPFVPRMLVLLGTVIFDKLPDKIVITWQGRLINAVESGVDLSQVGQNFLHWLLTHKGVNPGIEDLFVCDAIQQCAAVVADLAKDRNLVSESAARVASTAARKAAQSALRVGSIAGSNAAFAAISAVYAASSTARADDEAAANYAAECARRMSASAAYALGVPDDAAAVAAFVLMADKLTILIGEAHDAHGGPNLE